MKTLIEIYNEWWASRPKPSAPVKKAKKGKIKRRAYKTRNTISRVLRECEPKAPIEYALTFEHPLIKVDEDGRAELRRADRPPAES